MILFFIALCTISSLCASEAQKQFDRAWAITQNEIALSASLVTKKRNLNKYISQEDVRWQTVKNLPEALKTNFFSLVRNATINNPRDYRFMRNYIAGCAWAGCVIKEQGFDEERLIKLMIENNDVQLLGLIELE